MARRMNYDRARIREWQAEARRERAMEIDHERLVRIETREQRMAQPATKGQRDYIVSEGMHKHCGHDDAWLETMTVRAADAVIKRYLREVKGKKSNQKPRPTRKAKTKPKRRPLTTVFETQGKPDMSGPNIIRSKGPVGR